MWLDNCYEDVQQFHVVLLSGKRKATRSCTHFPLYFEICTSTILQEMLRKARQQQQHNRKAKQHNTTRPKQSFFKEKLGASGGTRTHDHQLSRTCTLRTSKESVYVALCTRCKIKNPRCTQITLTDKICVDFRVVICGSL